MADDKKLRAEHLAEALEEARRIEKELDQQDVAEDAARIERFADKLAPNEGPE